MADLREPSDAELRLRCGEMTAAELRACRAGYRLALAAQPAPASVGADALPKAREVARIGDMCPNSALRIGIDSDGDVYLSCTAGFDGVEFCATGSGGGKSPRTHKALIALMVAIEEDNGECPSRDWLAKRNGRLAGTGSGIRIVESNAITDGDALIVQDGRPVAKITGLAGTGGE